MSVVCEQCGKSMKSGKTLKNHVESVHEKIRKHVCPICDKAFYDKGKLKFHQHKHSEVRNFHCEECGRSFKTRSDLYQHFEIHDKGKTFKCEECDLEVAKRSTYEAHLRTHTSKGDINCLSSVCRYCKKEFKENSNLQRHIASVHEKVINFVCEICNKGFTRKDRFAEHNELHRRKAQLRPKRVYVEGATVHLESDEEDPVEDGEYPCDSCSNAYRTIKAVTRHKMKIHETLNKLQCDDCPETFFSRIDLNSHQEVTHGKTIKPDIFKCDECQLEFLESNKFYLHYKTKHPKATFKCENCSMKFKKRSSYDIHVRQFKDLGRCFNIPHSSDVKIEDSDRKYSCNICEKSYKTIDYLKKHRRLVHQLIKNYVCEICHAAFMNHCEFLYHQQNRHSKKTSFVCEDCGQGFKIKSELNKHFETHDKGKTFSCSLCPLEFSKRSSFELHLRRHEIIKSRTCEDCGKIFRDMKQIGRHMRKVHGKGWFIYICDCCGNSYDKKRLLREHMKDHIADSVKIKKRLDSTEEFISAPEIEIKEELQDIPESTLDDEWEELIEGELPLDQDVHFEQLIIGTVKEEPEILFKVEVGDYFYDNDFDRIPEMDDSDSETNLQNDLESVKEELKIESDEDEDKPLIRLLRSSTAKNVVVKKTNPTKSTKKTSKKSSKSSKEPTIIECKICNKTFNNNPALRTHNYRLHNTNPNQVVKKQTKKHPCPTCGQTYYSKQCLDEHHRAIHDKARDFVCEVCNLDFAWKNSLDRHKCPGVKVRERQIPQTVEKVEIKDLKVEIEVLKEESEEAIDMEVDVKMEDSEDEASSPKKKVSRSKWEYKCEHCDMVFKNSGALRQHRFRKHNPNKVKKFTIVECDVCEKEFSNKDSLRQHKHRKHKPGKKIPEKSTCEVCFLEFKSKDALRQHTTRKHSARPPKPSARVQCPVCELWFNSRESMGMHRYRKHSANPPPKKFYCKSNHACEYCGNTYHSKQNLEAHQRAVHLGCKDFTCVPCDLHFAWEKSYKSHNDIHHKIRVLDVFEEDENIADVPPEDGSEPKIPKSHDCSICSKSFMSAHHLLRHNLLVHEKQQVIFCNFCPSTFRTRVELKSHSKEVHSKDCIVDCVFCEHSFTNKDSCDQHEVDIHDLQLKAFGCSLCNKTYTIKNNLRKHQLDVHLHPERKYIFCKICKERFVSYKLRLKHMQLIHEDGDKLTRDCGVCQEKFNLAQDFFDHITTHEGCFICSICGVNNVDQLALKHHKFLHRKVNIEEKKIVCDTCGMRFLKKANLLVHMTLHTGETKFVCDECGKGFRYQSNLCDHKNIHTKKFVCSYCQKVFPTKQTMDAHINSHIGYKPYACDSCDGKYISLPALKMHQRTHSKEKRYKCHLCAVVYGYNISLRAHLLKHHGLIQEKQARGRPTGNAV